MIRTMVLLMSLMVCSFLSMPVQAFSPFSNDSFASYPLIPDHFSFFERSDIQRFIDTMVEQYQFDSHDLKQVFYDVKLNSHVLRLMTTPYEAQPWYQYRKRFLRDDLVDSGVEFWKQHLQTLSYAKKKYGVPENIIIAIIGIESHYGQNSGHFRVIDVLSTLAFHENARQTFFRDELVHFLLMCRSMGWDPLAIEGSYAGAIGAPQFMPSSYRRYAIAYHHEGHPDLINNMDDAIVSVANYLHQYGWKNNQKVQIPAKLSKRHTTELPKNSMAPEYTLQQLAQKGILPFHALPQRTHVGFIKLEHPNSYEYRLGLQNLYVITQYNTSLLYAMAVTMLGDKIEIKRNTLLKLEKAAQKKPKQTKKINASKKQNGAHT